MDLPLIVGFMMLIASFDIAPSGLVPINWKKNDSSDIDQEGKGGYRHPRREFMRVSDFGQVRCADFENQCYTGN